VSQQFWSLVYFIYGLGGGAASIKRSRWTEFGCFFLAGCLLVMWSFALATNYAANSARLPSAILLPSALIAAGLFFRDVRVRSAENRNYLAERRRAQ
jgi:hypothetical protein